MCSGAYTVNRLADNRALGFDFEILAMAGVGRDRGV